MCTSEAMQAGTSPVPKMEVSRKAGILKMQLNKMDYLRLFPMTQPDVNESPGNKWEK